MTSLALGRLSRPADGLRAFDPARDLAEVIALLRLGFGADLDERDRRWLQDLDHLSGAGPVLGWALALFPAAQQVFNGFVWEADGQVVANTSLLRATRHVWIIANVVTHPDYRGRGIARRLVVAAIDAARAHGATQVQLQVRDENAAANHLYRSLAFQRLFGTTLWRAAAPLAPVAELPPGGRLAEWGGAGSWAVESVLVRAGDIEGPAPGPIRQALARSGWRGRLTDFLHGQRRATQALLVDERWVAVAATTTNGVGPQTLELRVDPRWRGQAEAPLLAWALDRLSGTGDSVDADVREEEQGLAALLPAAGFQPVRTLDRLSKSL